MKTAGERYVLRFTLQSASLTRGPWGPAQVQGQMKQGSGDRVARGHAGREVQGRLLTHSLPETHPWLQTGGRKPQGRTPSIDKGPEGGESLHFSKK